MILVRFKETFRERAPEWALSAGLLAWGLLALSAPGLFQEQVFFHPLLRIMSQDWWGAIALIIGSVRLVFLVINGAWRPSAHIRAVGAFAGSMIWTVLLIAAFSLEWVTPTAALYSLLLSLDMLSLWFAAGDAKLADLEAKRRKVI